MDTLYRSWQLSGWLYHDIFVIIVAIIFIVISGILVISLIRRRSTRRLVPCALILLVYLAVIHFAGLIFFGMFREKRRGQDLSPRLFSIVKRKRLH